MKVGIYMAILFIHLMSSSDFYKDPQNLKDIAEH